MKTPFVLSLMLAAALACADDHAPATTSSVVKGQVLEVKDVEGYTYLRLKTQDGETWAAVAQAPVKPGAVVTIDNPMVMNNFESKSLKKTFSTIVFGNLAGAAPTAGGGIASAHAGAVKSADAGDVRVSKAPGADGRTVAEIVAKRSDLNNRTVVVHAKVVKFNAGIMGKNWVHVRDGSGSEADNSHDILVTTQDVAKVGDTVTVRGVVHTNRDFGSGYAYKVLVEDATLK
jgi:hypothetical protein